LKETLFLIDFLSAQPTWLRLQETASLFIVKATQRAVVQLLYQKDFKETLWDTHENSKGSHINFKTL